MAWLASLKEAKKSVVVENGVQKVHYLFPDGSDMMEDYDEKTNLLILRARRQRHPIRGTAVVEVEVGEMSGSRKMTELDELDIRQTVGQPHMIRRDNVFSFEWRIRNLPYKPDNFIVTADNVKKCLEVRTKNRKFYKQIRIPDMDRVGAAYKQEKISFLHKNNTLIISYEKPGEVMQLEREVKTMLASIKGTGRGNSECKTN